MVRIFYLLVVVFSIWMLVDVYRRKAPLYWYAIILFVPFGALIYFIFSRTALLSWGQEDKSTVDLEYARRKFNETPSTENRLQLGFSLLDAGRVDEARTLFMAVVAVQPEDKDALFGQGLCAMRQKEYDEAITCFSHITSMHAAYRDYSVWPLLAEAYWLKRDFQHCVRVMQIVYKLRPRVEYRLLLAKCYIEMKEIDTARHILQETIEIHGQGKDEMSFQDARELNQCRKLLRRIS